MSKKTIILKVYSDPEEYGALTFEEDSETTVTEFVQEIRDSGQKSLTRKFKVDPACDQEVTGELLEFDADIPEDTWKAIKLKLLGTDNVEHCDYYWIGYADCPEELSEIKERFQDSIVSILRAHTDIHCGLSYKEVLVHLHRTDVYQGWHSRVRGKQFTEVDPAEILNLHELLTRMVTTGKIYIDASDNYRGRGAEGRNLS